MSKAIFQTQLEGCLMVLNRSSNTAYSDVGDQEAGKE